MQATGDETTDVLIDLIGTDDNDDESRPDSAGFSAFHPAINSALVVAQSTARPTAFNGRSDSGSDAGSSLRDESGRFSFDRIREELIRASTSKSHSDVTPLSWTRSVSSQGRDEKTPQEREDLQGPELVRLDPAQLYPPTVDASNAGNQHTLISVPAPKPPIPLLSPFNLNPPLSNEDIIPDPHALSSTNESDARIIGPTSLPVWQNIAGLFELMQSQMSSLSRALELAQIDSTALRERCLELEKRLGIENGQPNPTFRSTQSSAPQIKHPEDLISMTPPPEPQDDRPRVSTDAGLTFIRNIDELVWRRSLFARSPAELVKLASLPDCVRENEDVLDSRNLAALEERIRLWESIVRRTQTP